MSIDIHRGECEWCGRPFTQTRARNKKKFCDDTCRIAMRRAQGRYREAHYPRSAVWFRRCAVCGRVFTARSHQATRCGSPDCERWHNTNRCRPHRRVRQSLLKASTLPFTKAELDARMEYYGKCWICGGPWDQVDHVKPLSKGGPNILANLRPACGTCNRRKGNKWPFDKPRR